jgi:uncharacterized membrane protein YidH (DUF202 family)
MRHRRALFTTIWIIAIGVVLATLSAFPWEQSKAMYGYVISLGLQWSGIVVAILGIFALIMTFLNEYLDKEKKPSQKERKTTETA